MRISISLGKYATTPYAIPGLDTCVYCIEELSYLLGENAALIDQTIMSRGLVDWIARECELTDLADELAPLVERGGSVSNFVCIILEFTGLQDNYYIDSVRKILKRGAGLSTIERHKKQVDYLVEKKKFSSAVRGYRSLLEKWDMVSKDHSSILPGLNVLAAIHHNLGVAYTGLMLYTQAADAFEQAYKLDGNKEHYIAYLAAMRLGMSDTDYISFAASIPDAYDETMTLEKTIERLKSEWKQMGDAHRLHLRRQMRDGEDAQKYYSENERILKALKDTYRENVGV